MYQYNMETTSKEQLVSDSDYDKHKNSTIIVYSDSEYGGETGGKKTCGDLLRLVGISLDDLRFIDDDSETYLSPGPMEQEFCWPNKARESILSADDETFSNIDQAKNRWKDFTKNVCAGSSCELSVISAGRTMPNCGDLVGHQHPYCSLPRRLRDSSEPLNVAYPPRRHCFFNAPEDPNLYVCLRNKRLHAEPRTRNCVNSPGGSRGHRLHNYELSLDLQQKQMEIFCRPYGGYWRACNAAIVVQRAYRKYALAKKFERLRKRKSYQQSIQQKTFSPVRPVERRFNVLNARKTEERGKMAQPKKSPASTESSKIAANLSAHTSEKEQDCRLFYANEALTARPTSGPDSSSKSPIKSRLFQQHQSRDHFDPFSSRRRTSSVNNSSAGSATQSPDDKDFSSQTELDGSSSGMDTRYVSYIRIDGESERDGTDQEEFDQYQQQEKASDARKGSVAAPAAVNNTISGSGGNKKSKLGSASAFPAQSKSPSTNATGNFLSANFAGSPVSSGTSGGRLSISPHEHRLRQQKPPFPAIANVVCLDDRRKASLPFMQQQQSPVWMHHLEKRRDSEKTQNFKNVAPSINEPSTSYCSDDKCTDLPGASHSGVMFAPSAEYHLLREWRRVKRHNLAPMPFCDSDRRRQYRIALNFFNKKPERGIEFLICWDFVDKNPSSVAKFLISRKGLSKQMIGEYLGNMQNSFNQAVLHCFTDEIDMTNMHIDVALRKFQSLFRLPGEAQKIERIVEVFADRYCHCNPDVVKQFKQSDTVFILAFAIIMLNTDLHSPNVKSSRRMKVEDFIKNLRGVDGGSDVDSKLLTDIYNRVKQGEFKSDSDHVVQVMKVERSVVGKKPTLALPHRRLVCYCRLHEVSDPLKKQSQNAHQREIFLFNDMLMVTKILSRKKHVITYSFRQNHCLVGAQVETFRNQYYSNGLRINFTLENKTICFNTRSEEDREKFADDLRESILETDEMEALRIELELRKQNGVHCLRLNRSDQQRDSGVADVDAPSTSSTQPGSLKNGPSSQNNAPKSSNPDERNLSNTSSFDYGEAYGVTVICTDSSIHRHSSATSLDSGMSSASVGSRESFQHASRTNAVFSGEAAAPSLEKIQETSLDNNSAAAAFVQKLS